MDARPNFYVDLSFGLIRDSAGAVAGALAFGRELPHFPRLQAERSAGSEIRSGTRAFDARGNAARSGVI